MRLKSTGTFTIYCNVVFWLVIILWWSLLTGDCSVVVSVDCCDYLCMPRKTVGYDVHASKTQGALL